jgi:hypothetical protein
MTEDIQKILENHEKRITDLEKRLPKEVETIPISLEEGIKKFANKLGISEIQIKSVFDFEADSLNLIRIDGNDEREKTQNATLVLLLGYRHCYNNDEVSSIEIRRNLAENKISINNFSTHLNRIITSFLRRKGAVKSAKTSYKLTIPGEVKAKEIVKRIALSEGERFVENDFRKEQAD